MRTRADVPSMRMGRWACACSVLLVEENILAAIAALGDVVRHAAKNSTG